MRRMIPGALAILLAVQVAAVAAAGEAQKVVTLAGDIVCAKCTLKIEGLKECHNVLVVTNDKQEETRYWLVQNDVAKAFGEVCSAVKPVVVTGTVEEKDGKIWISPSKIDPGRKS